MNSALTQLKLKLQHVATSVNIPLCSVWQRGSFVHLSFRSSGCAYGKKGYCTMCDYGCGDPLSVDDVEREISNAFFVINEPVREVLIGSCGSILDEHEFPFETLKRILEELKRREFPSVIIETHYHTINDRVMNAVTDIFTDSKTKVSIELGFESADADILSYCLNKSMNLTALSDAIKLIKKYGMKVLLNIFFGALFLSPIEVVSDAIDSVKWAKDNGADCVVIFPSNIKPHTPAWLFFEKGLYRTPSLWLIIDFLHKISDEYLAMVCFSWYGERQKAGNSLYALPPKSCELCENNLVEFISYFNSEPSVERRKELICHIYSERMKCHCFSSIDFSIDDTSLKERAERLISKIQEAEIR